MKEPKLDGEFIRAYCPKCESPTTWDSRVGKRGDSFGVVRSSETYRGLGFKVLRADYQLYQCSSCTRGGVGIIGIGQQGVRALISFWPQAVPAAPLPTGAPVGVVKEFREAEQCATAGAWRGAAALLRSALEKTLKANGYDEKRKSLYDRIADAAKDTTITSARGQRAQDLVRTLGNDVLHDEWRVVTEGEVANAHLYVARIIEDFYQDRPTVEKVLRDKGRLKDEPDTPANSTEPRSRGAGA